MFPAFAVLLLLAEGVSGCPFLQQRLDQEMKGQEAPTTSIDTEEPTEAEDERKLQRVDNLLKRFKWPTEYRTFNGTGNNLNNTQMGAVQQMFFRSTPANYSDGKSSLRSDLPNPREISNAIADQMNSTVENIRGATDLLWMWGQFLDHDLSFTVASTDPGLPINIPIPDGDPVLGSNMAINLTRSVAVYDSQGVYQQLNNVTAWIDASTVYGTDDERASALRGTAFPRRLLPNAIRTCDGSIKKFLPINNGGLPNKGGSDSENLFLAGDFRVNEHIGLIALHTLFLREHNYWANRLQRYSDDEEVSYQRARMIVTAEIQAITFKQFLPVLLGDGALPEYAGYDDSVNAGISNIFATAAFRVGHTMVSDKIDCTNSQGEDCSVEIKDAFFATENVTCHDIGPYLEGMAKRKGQEVDTKVVDSLRNFLFSIPGTPVPGGFDLVAINIQRGRDHGLPSYNQIRESFGLDPVQSWYDFKGIESGISDNLSAIYGSIDNCEAWPCMLAEEHVQDAMVGETLRAVLIDQFTRIRDGDRFWYENYLGDDSRMLSFIESLTLREIIVRNTDVAGDSLPPNVFLAD